MEKYEPKSIELKWQEIWEKNPELSRADNSFNKPKKYILDMFPYPSGEGLHAGHVESYTATDIISRYLRMKGCEVLHPQGWDAFGLPAENYAIKTKIHPAETTKKAIATFKKQMKMMGFSYDWSREVNSSDPGYYKWTQWFFLLLYKNGLAYKKKGQVNWCDSCRTVLANEQAEGGVCERCGQEVVQKYLEQWYFKITDFIEDNKKTAGLLSGLDKIDWPESTKAGQRNWIGKSEGATIKFEIISNFMENPKSQIPNPKQISNSKNQKLKNQKYLEVFTTRIDTIFGCTFALIAPEHKLVQELRLQITNWKEVEEYIKQTRKKTDLQRQAEVKDKTGVELEGIKVINPFTKKAIPLFASDFILAHYGTGAVMAVPAHDERDFEFAKKFNLPIKEVIVPEGMNIFGSAALIQNKEGKFIFQKRDGNAPVSAHKIALFGGGSEPTESLINTLKRELKEEIDLDIDYDKALAIGKFKSDYGKDKFANIYFIKDIDSGKLILKEGEKLISMSLEEALARNDVTDYTKGIIKYFKENNNFSFTDDGFLISSDKYSGITSKEARAKMTEWLEKEKIGQGTINYKLRDWLVSRQRYWGAPIPIIYCQKCGMVPVPEKDLPVLLPNDVDFNPTGESPLKYSQKFQNVKCPICGAKAERESDTMDTFVCSSWYYFRYSDPQNTKEFASKKNIRKWLPVDLYVGGAEHAVLHLLYSRFFTKALHSLGYIDFDEPFLKLRHQGIILAEDGRKMSKSLENVVNPDEVVKKFGADSLRMFEMFMGPLEDAKPWNTRGIVGIYRFLENVYKLKDKKLYDCQGDNCKMKESGLPQMLHKTIKKVTEDIEKLRFNTAISQMMIFVNFASKFNEMPRGALENFLKLLAPFAPHLAEELWSELGHHRQGGASKESIFKQKWPEYNPELIQDEEIELVVQINGKVRDRIRVLADISEEDATKLAKQSEKIKNFIGTKPIKKIIFVKNRLINIVI